MAENSPIKSGNREKSIRKRRELNGVNFIEDIDTILSLYDVPIIVAKQFACNAFWLITESDKKLDIFFDVFLEDGLLVDEVFLEILFVDPEEANVGSGFEGNGLSLDVGRHICEV